MVSIACEKLTIQGKATVVLTGGGHGNDCHAEIDSDGGRQSGGSHSDGDIAGGGRHGDGDHRDGSCNRMVVVDSLVVGLVLILVR